MRPVFEGFVTDDFSLFAAWKHGHVGDRSTACATALAMDRHNFRTLLPRIGVVDQFRSDDFKCVSASHTIDRFCESVNAFSIGVCDPMLKVIENMLPAGARDLDQLPERLDHARRD